MIEDSHLIVPEDEMNEFMESWVKGSSEKEGILEILLETRAVIKINDWDGERDRVNFLCDGHCFEDHLKLIVNGDW
jgi:hypothetical protein